jgi:hypothetical protein
MIADALVGVEEVGPYAEIIMMEARRAIPEASMIPGGLSLGGRQ